MHVHALHYCYQVVFFCLVTCKCLPQKGSPCLRGAQSTTSKKWLHSCGPFVHSFNHNKIVVLHSFNRENCATGMWMVSRDTLVNHAANQKHYLPLFRRQALKDSNILKVIIIIIV